MEGKEEQSRARKDSHRGETAEMCTGWRESCERRREESQQGQPRRSPAKANGTQTLDFKGPSILPPGSPPPLSPAGMPGMR